jgi:hypothetical protein
MSGWSIAPARLVLLAALSILFSDGLRADVQGTVIDAASGLPIAGASVGVRARPDIPTVVTGPDGSFLLPLSEPMAFEVSAAVAYDPAAPVNYLTATVLAFDGDTGLVLALSPLPDVEQPGYVPPSALGLCSACHFDYYLDWQASRHAGAAVNPWVLDLFSGTGTPGGAAGYVFRDLHDPGDTGFCATCHAPLEDVFQPGQLMLDEASTAAGLDGVTCMACHQLAHVNQNVSALHHLGNGEYRFPATAVPELTVFGPLADVSEGPMQNVWQPQFRDSRFCASCHEYDNPFTGAPGQTTYSEWLASPYAQPGPGFRSCQDCHMPAQQGDGFIGLGGPLRPGSQRHRHDMVGSTPATLAANIDLRLDVLQQGSQIVLRAEVENHCGHNFPTGISIRNALLVLEAHVNGEPLTQVAGPTIPFWGSDEVPGEQPGDYAGRPGKGFARVLEGRINGQGPVVRPVLFIDAEGVHSDTTIPSGATDHSEYRFALPPTAVEGDTVEVTARLLYRRAWRALAVTKGWTETPSGMPVEIEVQRIDSALVLGTLQPPLPAPVAVPVTHGWIALLLLGLGMVVLGWRHRP